MFTRILRSSVPSTATFTRRFLKIPTTFDLQHSSIPLTKIIATIGPTSEQEAPMKECVNAGMNIMRLNFSHATSEEVELRCANLKKADTNKFVSILLDTKGPELRAGKLANDVSGHDTVDLAQGATVTLHSSPESLPGGSTASDILIDFPVLAQVLEPGRQVLLDDGAVVLQVVEITGPNTIKTVVQHSGSLRSRAGVNLPKADTAKHLPALSEKDKADIRYGMEAADIDFVAASFVQTAQHVHDIRAHIKAVAEELGGVWKTQRPLPQIISKIETATALDNFDEILDASDGIMVARGDLGVEIPLVQVTVAQKEMIRACNNAGKPVIVATQMLETMSKKYAPTRAEVADVTNAVLDGADCVMLSGETAKGVAPANVIATMQTICTAAEYSECAGKKTKASATALPPMVRAIIAANPTFAILLEDATLASFVAAGRPSAPIFVKCEDAKQARHLQIHRGVVPLVVDDLIHAVTKLVGEDKTVVHLDSEGRMEIRTL